jgi:hypothetical protein
MIKFTSPRLEGTPYNTPFDDSDFEDNFEIRAQVIAEFDAVLGFLNSERQVTKEEIKRILLEGGFDVIC